MTKEEKAKAYDEALERAKKLYEQGTITESLSYVFPELKESEDERIRKCIGDVIREYDWSHIFGVTKDDCLAWLEKQGEQKLPIEKLSSEMKTIGESLGFTTQEEYDRYNQMVTDLIMSDDGKGEQNHTDKVEPKFNVGDWLIQNERRNIVKVVSRTQLDYEVVNTLGQRHKITSTAVENNYHLWTIQDAKDGDVLLFEGYCNSIVLFQGIGINGEGRINYHCKCDLGNYSFGIQGDVACLGTIEKNAEQYCPATKEQRDLLFQKMKESGYEWDAEKKELKKIEQEPTDNDIKEALRTEYEKGRADAIAEIQKPVDCTDCTNSKGCINCKDGNIKETLVRKPAWTEADEKIGKDLIDFCIKCSQGDTVVNSQDDFAKWATWLKSLKERIGG